MEYDVYISKIYTNNLHRPMRSAVWPLPRLSSPKPSPRLFPHGLRWTRVTQSARAISVAAAPIMLAMLRSKSPPPPSPVEASMSMMVTRRPKCFGARSKLLQVAWVMISIHCAVRSGRNSADESSLPDGIFLAAIWALPCQSRG